MIQILSVVLITIQSYLQLSINLFGASGDRKYLNCTLYSVFGILTNVFINQIYLVFGRMFLSVTTLPGAGDDSGVGEDEDEDGGGAQEEILDT